MKPLHWTLLALCVASCRSGDRAVPQVPEHGPGSRLVVPNLTQPTVGVESPAKPAMLEAQPSLDPIARSAPESSASGTQQDADESLHPSTQTPTDTGTANTQTAVEKSAAPSADEIGIAASQQAPVTDVEAERDAAIAAILAGNDALARKHLDALLARPSLENARKLSEQGKYAEALGELEQALASAPNRADLLEAAGYARLALADAGDRSMYALAHEAFERAGPTPTALLGQSRAARRMGLMDESLDCARRALVLLSVQPPQARLELDPAAEVVLADAGLEVHRRLRLTPGSAADALLAELVAALLSRIDDMGTDATAHARLCALYLDVGKVFEAVASAERGMDFSPSNAELAQLLARAALSAGGPAEVVAIFGRVSEKFPRQALVYWYPAVERFKSSLAGIKINPKTALSRQLEQASAGFRECRSLDPRFEKACLDYEVLCVGARGWQLFAENKLEPARVKFLSMNTIAPNGIALDPARVNSICNGRLESGLIGLARIAERYRDVEQDLPKAAAVFADLATAAPSDSRWVRAAASSAGLAAEAHEKIAEDAERAISGQIQDVQRLNVLRGLAGIKPRVVGSDKERERFVRLAATRRTSAQESYAKSWQYYQAAVELEPNDARLACDAARVAVYRTKSAPVRAEELLLRSIQLAQEQIATLQLDPNAKAELERTLGDALQDLGVFELETKNDPRAASLHLEQSLSAGTTPRPFVREVLLPRAVEASKSLQPQNPVQIPPEVPAVKQPR